MSLVPNSKQNYHEINLINEQKIKLNCRWNSLIEIIDIRGKRRKFVYQDDNPRKSPRKSFQKLFSNCFRAGRTTKSFFFISHFSSTFEWKNISTEMITTKVKSPLRISFSWKLMMSNSGGAKCENREGKEKVRKEENLLTSSQNNSWWKFIEREFSSQQF